MGKGSEGENSVLINSYRENAESCQLAAAGTLLHLPGALRLRLLVTQVQHAVFVALQAFS